MQKWSDEDGTKFKNSDICFGKEFKPKGTDMIDVAKISIRGKFPAVGYGYLEESHEMAVVVRGQGYIETKAGDHHDLTEGDVIYVGPMERFRWGGDMDLIIPCGPAFDPTKHKLEEEAV